MIEDIIENKVIESIAKHFSKPPHRINRIHEADAEVIDLEGDYCLAVTTDAIIEEITSGLYDDPYLMGWMLAMVNFSDLAAVGANPLGLVVSINYPKGHGESFIQKLSEGISQACQKLNSFVLGGDTNQCEELFLSACGVGTIPKKSIITRIGARPGDQCYLSGPAGLGAIFAFLKLSGQNGQIPQSFYQPIARIKEGQIVREFAQCCMDTSDGVIHTLDTLMRLNHCQFILYDNWNKILHPTVLGVCKDQNLPPWITLGGVHGEFELLFTVDPSKEKDLLNEAAKIGWSPIHVGEVAEGHGVTIESKQKRLPIDSGLIRNLSDCAGSDHQTYIGKLMEITQEVVI